jgi:3-oxoacyl-[acyl-carrier protein] reductase
MATIVGMAHMESSIDVSMDLWDLDHRRNLRYVFLAARELARRLIARGETGAIASVASVDGIRASQHHASYGAAKAGLISLAKSLSGEWSQYGVRMNIVAPGGIVTPRAKLRAPEVEFEQMKLVPMQRRGTIDDIASALVFLLSEQAVYITGQTVAVDGGLTGVGPIDYSYLAKMKGATGLVKDPLDVSQA